MTDGGLPRIVLDVEKATPVLYGFDVGEIEDGKVTVGVDNVVIGLWYGIGHSETPVGPYVVDEWVRATSVNRLELPATEIGPAGFYRVMARE